MSWQQIEGQYLEPHKGMMVHSRITVCYLCGTWQDSIEGLGHGSCGACIHGMLAAYGRKNCGYKHCTELAVAFVPRKRTACAKHFPKSGLEVSTAFATRREMGLGRIIRTAKINCWINDDGSMDHRLNASLTDESL